MRLNPAALRSIGAALLVTGALAACSDDDPTGPRAVPPTIASVSGTSATTARVTWSAISGASSYVVQRAATGAQFADVGSSTGTTYDDAGPLAASTTYRYRVASIVNGDTSDFSVELSGTTLATGAQGTIEIEGNITSNRRLDRDTVYVIKGFVRVTAPATLTIESGTRIVGDFETPGSALFILQGARIDAQGTADAPIVMTSERAAGTRQPGDWGGLILVGNGIINRTGSVILEGTTEDPVNYGASTEFPAGTKNNADNSGTLRYVRVEFAGYPVLPNAELNSFTIAAVGRGTTLEYLQAVAGLDDAYEWFGGAVDSRYLVSYETGDDHFDASEGFVGRNQFLIALQDTVLTARSGLEGGPSSDPQGFEVDGCDGANCPLAGESEPYSVPVFANFTIVGTGSTTLTPANGGVGMVLRRGAGGVYMNGIVARWPNRGISIRDAFTDQLVQRDSLMLRNILFAGNTANFDPAGSNFGQATRFAGMGIDSVATIAGLFTALPANPANAAAIDWTPPAGSPAATGGLVNLPALIAARAGGFVTGTSYRGAADPAGAKWWAGWTVYVKR